MRLEKERAPVTKAGEDTHNGALNLHGMNGDVGLTRVFQPCLAWGGRLNMNVGHKPPEIKYTNGIEFSTTPVFSEKLEQEHICASAGLQESTHGLMSTAPSDPTVSVCVSESPPAVFRSGHGTDSLLVTLENTYKCL